MGCIFRIRFNQLGSIWYTILCVLIQLYLLYLGLNRYWLYTEMKWPHGAYPHIWLTVYVTILAVCIPLLVLFTAFGIWKSGNLAGDHDHLGSRVERIIELSPRRESRRKHNYLFGICHSSKSCWQHLPPIPQTIHLFLATCQLFAQQIMLAQLYRFGFINSGDFLNTELDFLYQRSRQLVTNLPMGDTRLQGFRITSEELAESPIAPNLLPILMHARLFGIPLEFVNLVFALIAYSCVYPAVFWRLSKKFSLFFSLHLIIHSATIIWTYLAFSILFRVQETNYFSNRPIGIGQYLWPLRPFLVYHPLAIIITFIVTIVLMQFSPIIFYAYGYNKYITSLAYYRHLKSIQKKSPPPTLTSVDNNSNALQIKLCCDGYGPHISAIFILMFIVIAKASNLYALTLLYQHDERPLILTCIIIDVVYLFTWIILWLVLTLKREWKFDVVYDVRQILSLQDAYHTADGNFQSKNLSELKHSLLVMHRKHLFITDDPLAKQSIMRHIMQACGEEDVYWLRGIHSPTNRRIVLEEHNSNTNRSQNTPEMGRLLDNRAYGGTPPQFVNANCSIDYDNLSKNVSLAAAPPYHQHLTTSTCNTSLHQQQVRRQSKEIGSHMINSSPSCQHRVFDQMYPESYASIHRTSLRNTAGRDYGIFNGSTTVSPQILRKPNFQSNTLGRYSRMTREVIIGGPPLPNANLSSNNMEISRNNGIYGQIGNYDTYNNGGKVNSKLETSSVVSLGRVNPHKNGNNNNNNNNNGINNVINNNRKVDALETDSMVGKQNAPNTYSSSFTKDAYANKYPIFREIKNSDSKQASNKFVSFNDKQSNENYASSNPIKADTLNQHNFAKFSTKHNDDMIEWNGISNETLENGGPPIKNDDPSSMNSVITPSSPTVDDSTPLTTTTMTRDSSTSNMTSGTYTGSQNSTGTIQQKNGYYGTIISETTNKRFDNNANNFNYATSNPSSKYNTNLLNGYNGCSTLNTRRASNPTNINGTLTKNFHSTFNSNHLPNNLYGARMTDGTIVGAFSNGNGIKESTLNGNVNKNNINNNGSNDNDKFNAYATSVV